MFTKAAVLTIVALSTGLTMSKNVFNPKLTDDQIHNMGLEIEQKEFQLGKREAKNVVDLNFGYDDPLLKKRDAKNVFDAQVIIDDMGLTKREGKNVFDFNLVIDDATLTKRDGKNVFDLDLVLDEAGLKKKEAKNTARINFIIDDDLDLVKRGVEDVINLSLTFPEREAYLSSFEDPMSLGYIIGDSEYIATYFENSEESLSIQLTEDSNGCHNKKNILHLESLSEILNTFKEKMLNPIIGSQDKFPIVELSENDKHGKIVSPEGSLIEPIDVASALAARADISLFAKYLRDLPELYHKCETIEEVGSKSEKDILIFAPTNDALMTLKLKPWQFPEDIEAAKNEQEQDEIIKRNIYNFVGSHVAEAKGIDFSNDSKAVKIKTFNGKTVILENEVTKFRIKAEDSDEWSDITDIEVFRNGAIVTLTKPLVRQ